MRGVRVVLLLLASVAAFTIVGHHRNMQSAAQLPTPFPETPLQHTPWNPPATNPAIPEILVSATKVLFDQGLADPRGCEYREIEIAVGNIWNGGGMAIKTHGWLLPESSVPRQQILPGFRYAVAWNGLLYRVLSYGKAAKLAEDAAGFKQPANMIYASATPEDISVSLASVFPIRVCLLLRMGENELASKVWAVWLGQHPPRTNNNDRDRADPYLGIATDLAWARFDRAVCAHMRGDDTLAYYDSRALETVGPLIEAVAARRGLQRPYPNRDNPAGVPYLGFLGSVSSLRVDSERRVRDGSNLLPPGGSVARPEDPRHWPVDRGAGESEAAVARIIRDNPEKANRIRALIGALDLVAARQWGQPGGVGLDDNPVSAALIREGEDAVEPLLDCMEKDGRLTRSVSFGRDFHMGRNLLTVKATAFAVIARVLRTYRLRPEYTPKVAVIRAYWNRNRGIPLAERWYRALADGSAAPDQWIEAARGITERSDIETIGMWVTDPVRRTDRPLPPMRGELLRQNHSPTVTEMLARRVDGIATTSMPPNGQTGAFQTKDGYADGITLGLLLADWDLPGAIPTLKLLMGYARAGASRDLARGGGVEQLAQRVSRITVARIRAKDSTAVSDYAAWLEEISSSRWGSRFADALQPFWECRENTELSKLADRLFNGPPSQWNPILGGSVPTASMYSQQKAISSSLLTVPAFRKQVLRELQDRRPAAQMKVGQRGSVDIAWGRSKTGMGSFLGGGEPPPVGTTIQLRVCDMWAFELASANGSAHISRPTGFIGVPVFDYRWSETRRDAAIGELATYVTRYGPHLVPPPDPDSYASYAGSDPFIALRLVYPVLLHPASTSDVRATTAIFTLEDIGVERRVVKADAPYPYAARWKTNTSFGSNAQVLDPGAKTSVAKVLPDNYGAIWQIEEVRVNGLWKRFYGWVGRHRIARVPDGEIELLKLDGTPMIGPAH